MKSGIVKSHLPGLATHVRKIMKSREMTVKRFARSMNITPQTACRLLRRDDWKVSEIIAVGALLHVNLFEFFTPQPLAEINVQRERIAQLEEEIRKKQQEEEMKKQQLEIALLREILGAKANGKGMHTTPATN